MTKDKQNFSSSLQKCIELLNVLSNEQTLSKSKSNFTSTQKELEDNWVHKPRYVQN